MSTLAVVLALGGTAVAATKIGTSQIKDAAVTSAKLHDGAVTARKLASGAIVAQGDARYVRSRAGTVSQPMQSSSPITIDDLGGARVALGWARPMPSAQPECYVLGITTTSSMYVATTNLTTGAPSAATFPPSAMQGAFPITLISGTYSITVGIPSQPSTFATMVVSFDKMLCSATYRIFG